MRGENDEAEKYFRKAIECDPSFALSHFTLAWLLEKEGRGKEAADEYLAAADWLPGCAWYQYMAGHALFSYQGKVKEAIAHLEAAVHIAPDYLERIGTLDVPIIGRATGTGPLRSFGRRSRIDPNDTLSQSYLGEALRQ